MKKLAIFLLLLATCICLAQEAQPQVPDAGNVTLPLSEYNHLVELASKPPKRPEAPPLPYAIKSIDMKLRVENESVLGTIQVEGEVLSKGITKIPLTSGMTVLDVRQEGKPVPLRQEGGTQVAVLTGPTEFSLTLDAGLPLAIENKRASFNIPVPAAGSAQMSLVIPGEHTAVNITPGLITSQSSANGRTALEATLSPSQSAVVWWATREVVAPVTPREVRFLSSVKTLVTVGETDLRLAALADVTVVQGEPAEFALEIPAGYELTGATGTTLDSAEVQSGVLVLKVADPSVKSHQFLISLEKAITATKVDVPFLAFRQAQRETGEVLVEGAGTMELTATESGSLKRMDVKETNAYLRSLVHFPPQAAFRYHRQPTEPPALVLDWVRFPDTAVLAAVADNAQVTTLVTSEGKSLTEVKLTVRNQAQPFLKVELPTGASIVSADVAGEKVKPVQGTDGNRVPLLRPGFRPTDAYTVSFVIMHSGTPFAKKGGSELTLPKLDIPIGLLQWELFLPEQYRVKDFGGDAISANLVKPPFVETDMGLNAEQSAGLGAYDLASLSSGEIGGVVIDQSGAVVPGAHVTVSNEAYGFSRTVVADDQGRWIVSDVPAGSVTARSDVPGFKPEQHQLGFTGKPFHLGFTMRVGSASEMVTVEQSPKDLERASKEFERELKINSNYQSAIQNNASSNVVNLQKRVAGVLPVAVEVPKTGTSFRFIRPLVLGEETKVTFTYSSSSK